MRGQTFNLNIVDAPGETVGRRVLLTLRKAILDGAFHQGTPLAGSRVMAEAFGVHRQTVIAALERLKAEGLLESRPCLGTFVIPPAMGCGPEGGETRLGFDVPSALGKGSSVHMDAIILADGAADPRLAPSELLARGYRRALSRHGSTLLEDRDPLGTPLLREMVAEWLASNRSVRASPGRILLTRGSRGALALVVSSLLKAGDAIAVENPGNRGAWEILAQGGRHALVPLRVDGEGVVPEALEEAAIAQRIRAVYLTPGRQFPTGASLPRARADRILEIAARHRMVTIEDDYDSTFAYDGAPPTPLLAADQEGLVIHMGSLSRIVAPGLRLGYMVLPGPLVSLVRRIKQVREEQGDPAIEWALGDLIRDGDFQRHVRRATLTYQARRDFLVAALRSRLGHALEVDPPSGGMGLWIRARAGLDAERWIRHARGAGLILHPPSRFFMNEVSMAFRMGFSQVPEADLEEAVNRLAIGLEQMTSR